MDLNQYIEQGLTHSLHNSELASYRGCRRRWDWVARQMHYPKITVRPLEFGVAFHEAMEAYYGSYLGHRVNPDPSASLALAILAFKKKCKEQRDKYAKDFGTLDDEKAADYKDRLELGEKMLRYYFGKIAPEKDRGLIPRKVEIKFEVPIFDPNWNPKGGPDMAGSWTDWADGVLWCKCDHCWRRWMNSDTRKVSIELYDEDSHNAYRAEWKGLPVTFGGRIDAIMEDEHGRIWIYDWKTAARISGEEQVANDDFLWVEAQITGYCWALWSLGLDVTGFIYAEIKKTVPQEPERLTRPYKGRWFSTNKQQSTTYEMSLNTFKEYDQEAYENGSYGEYLDFLKNNPTMFHKRHEVRRTDSELVSFAKSLYAQAKEITDPDIGIYPNPGKFHCGSCAFFEPCIGKNRNEDYLFTLATMFDKRTRHYWEDAPATTDKRMGPAA